MNYETTIRAEAADGVSTDYAGARTLAGPRVPRWLIIGGLGLFGLLLAIDAFIDPIRTSVNVVGHCTAPVVVARWEGTRFPAQPTGSGR